MEYRNFFEWLKQKWSFWIIVGFFSFLDFIHAMAIKDYAGFIVAFITTLIVAGVPYFLYYLVFKRKHRIKE